MIARLLLASWLILAVAGCDAADFEQSWTHDLTQTASSVVPGKNAIYAAVETGEVVKLSAKTGTVLWQIQAPGEGTPLLAADAGNVYVLRGDSLITLAPKNGAVKKEVEVAIPPSARILAPESVGGRLLIQAEKKTFLVDPKSGTILFQGKGEVFWGPPSHLLASGKWKDCFDKGRRRGYFVAGNHVKAVRLADGKVFWSTEVPVEPLGPVTAYRKRVVVPGWKGIASLAAEDGQRQWTNRSSTKRPLSPYLYFFPGQGYFYVHIEDGFLLHRNDSISPRKNNIHRLPEISRILLGENMNLHFLSIYKKEDTGKWRSIVFRQDRLTGQLYGYDDVPGKATGLFAHDDDHLFVELSPGTLFALDNDQCAIQSQLKLSENAFSFLYRSGDTVVAVTASGQVVGITQK
jgi:PQQ-like domain